ncbi:TRAF-like [Arabidopsis thaliana x Arabidopsis arenosa]|uniref:TRAF-like n=1 Tax=Arabidopsis thaliana x Arabidopsis arenosa TaxID=1240361 RepID=A0A8T2AV14_9BRAS|nr:TRAF-like [Arabidopsis thaliana x Arabidopsis arenosa]
MRREKRTRPVPNQANGSQKLIPTQISSRDSKVSLSSTVKGLRGRPPSSYSLKMESFNTLMKSVYTERYESRPFRVGRYNWTLVVYPKGNKNDNGTGHISLYVVLDNSTLSSQSEEVHVDLRFYVFNKKEKKYFTIQDTDVWRFSAIKTMWGFSKVLPLTTFNNLKNGYLYDIDHCEFGVDVIIPPFYEKSELFSVTKSFPNARFTWFIQGFSTLPTDYLSEEFIIGGKSWNLRIFRNVDNWFSPQTIGWGYADFMPLSDLRNSSKGFVVNDMLVVQVAMEEISSTKYLPN